MTDGPREKRRILVVDDDAFNRAMLTEYFQVSGYEVRATVDALETMQVATEWQPHLAMLDMMMPHVDGLELLERLRVIPGLTDIPVLLVTASEEPGLEERALASGIRKVVRKPYRLTDLDKTVKELVGPPEPGAVAAG